MSNLILFFYLSLASARPALLPAVLLPLSPLSLSACLPFISQFATSHMDFISFMCSFLLPLPPLLFLFLLYSFLASASSSALIPFHCARLSSRLASSRAFLTLWRLLSYAPQSWYGWKWAYLCQLMLTANWSRWPVQLAPPQWQPRIKVFVCPQERRKGRANPFIGGFSTGKHFLIS